MGLADWWLWINKGCEWLRFGGQRTGPLDLEGLAVLFWGYPKQVE